jgi:hypothetical protein
LPACFWLNRINNSLVFLQEIPTYSNLCNLAELEAREICSVNAGKNQFAHTTFEISAGYWPYRRSDDCPESPEQKASVESVRTCFLSLGCGSGKFGVAEES